MDQYNCIDRFVQVGCTCCPTSRTIVLFCFGFFVVGCISQSGYTSLVRGDFDNRAVAGFKQLVEVSL
jgi:hypothetical protein